MVIFHTSDHKLLSYNLNIAKEAEDRTETRYDYKRMNVNGAREALRLVEWDKELNGTANENWDRLKELLFKSSVERMVLEQRPLLIQSNQ